MKLSRAGVDVAKSVFQVHAVDLHDQPRWRTKLRRSEWLDALSEHLAPGAEVGMEACASAHHWGRALQERGFRVKLIGAQFVKPYVKSNKNDRVDAEAICEAMRRPGMRFVALKSVAQQDGQAAHRIREALVAQRTAKANQIRGACRGVRHHCTEGHWAAAPRVAGLARRCRERVDGGVSSAAGRPG